jgi:1-acyl-sn-glycerol-3-phosphate acyltransferase
MSAFLLRAARLLVYLSLTFTLMPVQALLLAAAPALGMRLARRYHRLCCRLLGFEVELRGQPSDRHPVLFVANHVSYLDITMLGAVIKGSFIAKAEVEGWPLFGRLARLQRTVFVERRARHTAKQRDRVVERLRAGDDLILFPEGTSSDGNRVLPFRSGLLGAAETRIGDAAIAVQPVSIAYVRLDGMPMGRFYRPFFAWYGDMELAPHLWTLLGLGKLTVVVEFHAPVTLVQLGSRKALATHCQRVIADGVARALSGRDGREAATEAAVPNSAPLHPSAVAGLQA